MAQPSKLPHTISNFQELITQNYLYVDKTEYLEKMEALPQKYLFFLRPRRFGKSLFTTLLRYYYGIEHQSNFQELFGHLYIGQHPTPNANRFFILNMEFTKIPTTSYEDTFKGFLKRVKIAADDFLIKYKAYFTKEDRERVQKLSYPADVIELLILLMKEKAPKKQIYIVIDEYDHFANELIAFDFPNFEKIVGQNGFVRKFYEAIKEGTKEGVVGYFFATGITPITLDSMTSGFNIGTNISTDIRFVEMMGFTDDELRQVLDVAQEKYPINKNELIPELKKWYNGYKFNGAAKESLYNPSMILYFATYYQALGVFPETMLDKNVASDYHKIRRLLSVGMPKDNYPLLRKIVQQNTIEGELTEEFSFEKLFSDDDFLSLLFYNGFLTIKDKWSGITTFKVPNYVISRLYLSYFFDLLKEKDEINIKTNKIRKAIREMALKGNPQDFFFFIEDILKQLSNRDYQNFSEKYIKLLMMSTMLLTDTYYVESERETPEGYLDLSFTEQPTVEVNYEYLFELKYLKKENKKHLKTEQKEAKKQLLTYINSSNKFKKMKQLQAWTIVVIKDKLHLEKVN